MRRPLWRRRQKDELEDELRAHLGEAVRERMERGETRAEAESAARREFGNVNLVREVTYEAWGWAWLDRLAQDVRYGVRMMRRASGFTTVAILTLALGIGANTSIFTLMDKTLIRALPVEEPQRLVAFVTDGNGTPAIFSYPMYAELRERNAVLSGLAAYYQQPFSLSDGNQAERVIGQIVSGNYFGVLGVRPALGRFFLPEEDLTPGTHPVVVIHHGLWQRYFDADPDVLGKTISLNGYRYTVVGVAPMEFRGTLRGTMSDVYVPMMMQTQAQPGRNSKLGSRGSGWLRLIGRLKPDVSHEQAQAGLSILTDEAKKAFPGSTDPATVMLFDGSRGHTDRVSDLALPLKLLMGVAGLVLLIACANVANLLLARASTRRREMAVRLAIGASRARIVRQLLTESMVLVLLGGAAGLVVSAWVTSLLLGFQQPTNFVPRTFDGSLDGRAMGFTLALSLLTGIVFGLVPALQAARRDLLPALKDDVPRLGVGARRWGIRNILVVAQVALSLVVLIGAGLCVQSLRRLQAIDPGLESAKVLTASFDLSQSGYDEVRGQQFLAQLSERVAALPGVEAVSLARGVVLSDFVWIRSATIEGYQPQPGERVRFDFNVVSPAYFQTIGTPVVTGRQFTSHDGAEAPRVVIINETTARRYWPGQEAVGKRLKYGNVDQFAEVIGIVRDSKSRRLTARPRPAIYAPLLQDYAPDVTLHVRTAGEPQALLAAVRGEVQVLDPALPVYNLQPLAEQKDGSLHNERLAAGLFTLFGFLALLLASIGLYGVLSYVVTERTREIGIRMALGAEPRDVLKLVTEQGMMMTLIGLVIGVGAALALTRFIERLLFGVSATDPLTFVVITLMLTSVALVACFEPAWRATRLNPLVALRDE